MGILTEGFLNSEDMALKHLICCIYCEFLYKVFCCENSDNWFCKEVHRKMLGEWYSRCSNDCVFKRKHHVLQVFAYNVSY